MDIASWSLKIKAPIGNCNQEELRRRYLELRGYPGGAYCITRIVGFGTVKECAELLRSKSFVTKVMDAMEGIIRNSGDI